MLLNEEFLRIYEELSEINDTPDEKQLTEGAAPKYTSELVNLNDCREIVSTKFNRLQGGYETNCVTQVNDQLSRVEVRVFVLRKENDEIYFLGRRCNRSTGYTTPGGGFDLVDKTPVETAKRELREELNINLTNVQESAVHSFYSLPRCSWVKNYVENPEDRWTGYYQYYVTAEYAGDSDNDKPEELGKFHWLPVSVYENLTDEGSKIALDVISGHKWTSKSDEDLVEKFDAPGAEAVYGEEATTIDGVLRYFVEDIPTLAAIVGRERIKVSQQKETDTNTPLGDKYHKKRSFVSFSRQLFSHAYRAPKKWKYGIAVSQKAIEDKAQQVSGADICPDFDHPGNNMMVFGAAKLQDGTELLITSFGSFIMNLNEETRKLLKQHQNITVETTNFYDKIKNFFDSHIELMRAKKPDKLISYTEKLSEVEKLIRKRRNTDSNVTEGFVLRSFCRLHALAPKFPELYKKVPGLFEYLKEHTNLNEGEFRIWVDESQQYLDISDCIVGIVLPSNYKENNFDNLENTAPDVIWLRKLVKEKDLTIYVYQSKEDSNIPDIDLSKKRAKTLERQSIMSYFYKITRTKEAAIEFIKNELPKLKLNTNNFAIQYAAAIGKNTTTTQIVDVVNTQYNYRAFLDAIQEFGLTAKDVAAIYQTGQPMPNAESVFNEKIKSLADIQAFLKLLRDTYPDMPNSLAYNTWFINNTNATVDKGNLKPESISWKHFAAYCKQNFNYNYRDLTAVSKDQSPVCERAPIKELFKKAAKTNRKTTLLYIKNMAKEYPTASPAQSYQQYMGKYATDKSNVSLGKDTDYNYRAWLEKVTDPNGPVKLTREEVLSYFKDCVAETQNNN